MKSEIMWEYNNFAAMLLIVLFYFILSYEEVYFLHGRCAVVR